MIDEQLDSESPSTDHVDPASDHGDESGVEDLLFDLDDVPERRQTSMVQQATRGSRVLAPEPDFLLTSGRGGLKRVSQDAFNEKRLDPKRIEKVLDQPCPCARRIGGRSCLVNFDFGAIAGLRHARVKLGAAEEYHLRATNLNDAASRSTTECRLFVSGKSVCLRAYCMVFDYNESSMRRSWSKVKQGLGVRSVGRPRGPQLSLDPIGDNIQKQSCYAWLKAWVDVIADVDPVGIKYKLAVNYVRPQDLYDEYVRHYNSNTLLLSDLPLSFRRFCVVWEHFKTQEKIRVRRKANTTTKCSGQLFAATQSK